MSKTHAKPYISGFGINLNKFVLKQVGLNQRNVPIKQYGVQYPQMVVEQTLYLGTRSVGKQEYTFGQVAQPPSARHNGLPTMNEVLPPDGPAVQGWLTAIDLAVDAAVPEYRDESLEAAAAGPAVYLRINRIESQMTWDKPAEQFVGVLLSAYEDADYTRQIEDVLIYITFGTDEYVKTQASQAGVQGELTVDGINQVRDQLSIFSLKDFLADPAVSQGIGIMGQSFFTTLKQHVYNFSEIDVATIMANFVLPEITT